MIEAAAELPLRRRFNRIRKPVEETALLGRNVNTVCVCARLSSSLRDSCAYTRLVLSSASCPLSPTCDYIVIARGRS